jgi:tetratricopeptide (TPR) repeat protein
MVANTHAATDYAAALEKTRRDVSTLLTTAERDARDVEKRVRLAYRQFHLASLTEAEPDYRIVEELIGALLREFGPLEDVCLLKANVDGRFHRLDRVKEAFRMCPRLGERHAGRSLLADIDFQEGRYAEAGSAFRGLLEEERTWDLLARLAHWTSKMGDPEEADRLYDEAQEELTAKEMSSFAWLALQRGSLALSRGRFAEARRHYEQAAAGFSGHWRTDEHMAALLAAEGDLASAERLLRDIIERVPKVELRQALGEVLAADGRNEEARHCFESAAAAFLASVRRGGVHYYHHLADLYADDLDKPAEGVRWARKDVALRSNYGTQSMLAWALFRNGDLAEALEWIRLALGSGVHDAGVYSTAATLFGAAGDRARADSYQRAARAINPSDVRLHLHH